MDDKQPSGSDRRPEFSSRERIIALALLVLIASLVWLLLEPPSFLRRLSEEAPTGLLISDPYIGNLDAPVKIYEYNDFACVKCRQWQTSGIREQILEQYAGKVVFIWRDFPISSSFTRRAAEAGQCANDQGKFWLYHDYLYDSTQGYTDEKLILYAGELGLDVKAFDECLIGGEMRAKVAASREAGYESGVRTAPTLVIDGKILVGVSSLAGLSRVVEEALSTRATDPGGD